MSIENIYINFALLEIILDRINQDKIIENLKNNFNSADPEILKVIIEVKVLEYCLDKSIKDDSELVKKWKELRMKLRSRISIINFLTDTQEKELLNLMGRIPVDSVCFMETEFCLAPHRMTSFKKNISIPSGIPTNQIKKTFTPLVNPARKF